MVTLCIGWCAPYYVVGMNGPVMLVCAAFAWAAGMKFGGLLAPKSALEGPCPYCEGTVVAREAADCPQCKKRFLVRGGQFVRVPE